MSLTDKQLILSDNERQLPIVMLIILGFLFLAFSSIDRIRWNFAFEFLMLRERTTSYLRHLHLVVHSAQQRLRFPIYVIQSEVPSVESGSDIEEDILPDPVKKNSLGLEYIIPLSLLILLPLAAAIVLLSSLLAEKTVVDQCPIYDCSWINASLYSTNTTALFSPDETSITSVPSWNISNTTFSSLTSSTNTNSITLEKNLLYGDNCTQHEECTLSKNLFCELEFDPIQKHCFCETTYFWNRNSQQCEPKKDTNEPCEYDGECRLDLGIACDLAPDALSRRCLCTGEIYWAKTSNCANLKVQDFVHCIDQMYISSCLIRDVESGTYHNVNIRQVQNDEIQFDYFLVDAPELLDIERIECAWSMNKRFCFGIRSDTNQLLVTTIGIDGIQSFNNVSDPVIGLPNVLTQSDGTVVCYVEGRDSNLMSITIDPKNNDTLAVHQRGGKTYGDRSCFIAINRTAYCFYRDVDHHLTVVAMNGTATTQDVHSNINRETNLKTGPSCGWVGANILLKLYCFAVFNDEQIYRIEQKDDVWSEWVTMSSNKIFIQRPLFVTSQPPADMSTTQSCHVLAIDTSNEVYVSSNTNCAHQDLFSSWSLLQTDVGLLSFNGSFRLRDGRVGVYGVGIDDLPYYTTMDPATHLFEPIKLAVSIEG